MHKPAKKLLELTATGVTKADSVIKATAKINWQVKHLAAAKRKIRRYQLIETEKAGIIRNFMGPATALLDPTGTELLVTYRPHDVSRFDIEAFKKKHPKLYQKFVRDEEQRPLICK